MRKGTYDQYKKRHKADVKAGRSKSDLLTRKQWTSFHDHHDPANGESSHQKASWAAENTASYVGAKGGTAAEERNHYAAADAHAEVHKHVSEKKDGHHALRPAHSHPDVHDQMNKHKLEEDDSKELKAFKKAKPERGTPLSPQKLMEAFLKKAKPETKERMKGMGVEDFMKMYAAILDDEEPGAAKAATLRERTIRLAHGNPELRKHLLPLLKK